MQKTDDKVPVSQKIAWGMGGLPENLANNAILVMVYPIYQVALGLNPMWIGVALSISRVLDAITDPMMGNITDNTRSRWGRRRPWIFIGAILMSVFFALMWLIPTGFGEISLFVYFATMAVLFYIGFTIFIVPFGALGFELVLDYNERTKLQVYRLIPAYLGGLMLPWLYKLSLLDCFKHETLKTEVNGVRYVGLGAAIIILVCSLVPSLFTKERYASMIQEKIKTWDAIKFTFSDKPYLMILIYTFMVFLGIFFVNPLMTYINIFYICGGDKGTAAYIGGWAGTFCAVGQMIALPIIGKIAGFVDKKVVIFTGLSIAAIGYASSWFLFDPEHPWLQLIPPLVANFGLCGCWIIGGSIVADICDYDELKTGKRREGMYSAVSGFVYKCTLSFVALLSSSILVWAGIKGDLQSLSMDIINKLRVMYLIIPAVAFILGILAMWKYPLTKAKVIEVQKQLEERRGRASLGA